MTTINGGSDGKNHVSNYQRPRPAPLQVATGYPMPTVAPPPRVYNNASVQHKPQAYPVTQAPPVGLSKSSLSFNDANVVFQGKDDLPCCGLGLGWLLFIVGFLLNPVWYVGFILLLCDKEPRERAGYIACTVGSALVTVLIVVGVVLKGVGII